MADDEAHYLLLYEYVEDMAQRREPHRAAHLETLGEEREAGNVPIAGAYDPPSGALIVFKGVDRDHIESYVARDPYMQAGLITSWRIERWNAR
ncbi:MAG: YciI family protein [Solirubrobacteraceae bacterium]